VMLENDPLVKVHLYGILATKYGAEHQFAIRTPRQAIAALDANYPGFRRDFLEGERYILIADDEERTEDASVDLTFSRDVHFVPKIEGQTFVTIPLVASVIGAGIAANVIGSLLALGIMVGLSLLLKPKQKGVKETKNKKDTSFAFSGPDNVTTQGVAVPLIYGRVFCGSVVISAGLSVSDVEITDEEDDDDD
jgi:predicted phage tail protein